MAPMQHWLTRWPSNRLVFQPRKRSRATALNPRATTTVFLVPIISETASRAHTRLTYHGATLHACSHCDSTDALTKSQSKQHIKCSDFFELKEPAPTTWMKCLLALGQEHNHWAALKNRSWRSHTLTLNPVFRHMGGPCFCGAFATTL